jgi:hypothetical protein
MPRRIRRGNRLFETDGQQAVERATVQRQPTAMG